MTRLHRPLVFALFLVITSRGIGEPAQETPDFLISGSFGVRESEWHGATDSNRVVLDVDRSESDPVASWIDEMETSPASTRYTVGGPPSGTPKGCWLNGVITEKIRFENGRLQFAIPEHSLSHYMRCGVNIHHWKSFATFDVWVKGPVGTEYSVTGNTAGSETLTGSDGSFGYSLRGFLGNSTHFSPSLANASSAITTSGTSAGPEITFNGEVYSKALTLTTGGEHYFGYSHIIQCPVVPWHTSNATLSLDLAFSKAPEPGLTVTGRVLDRETMLPLQGSLVTLGGEGYSTGPDGTFKFTNVDVSEAATLEAWKEGFLSQTRDVEGPEGAESIDVRDIALARETDKPVVESVDLGVDGIYIFGFSLNPLLTAKVNWNGNGGSRVDFEVNGSVYKSSTGEGPKYTEAVDVDRVLRDSLDPRENIIKVTAIAENGAKSDPFEYKMYVIPIPRGLRDIVAIVPQVFSEKHVGFDFDMPLGQASQSKNLGLVGLFKWEWGANASFDYTIPDGGWELAAGFSAEGKRGKRGRRPNFPGLTRSPKTKLYLGNKEMNAYINAKAGGAASPAEGITLEEYGIELGLSSRLELTRYSFFDIFVPGSTNGLSKFPGIERQLRKVSVIVWLLPSLEGAGTTLVSPFSVQDATVSGKIGLEGSWEPSFTKSIRGRVYVGSDVGSTFGYPAPVFRDITFRIYAGYFFKAWTFVRSGEVVLVNYTYPNPSNPSQLRSLSGGGKDFDIQTVEASGDGWEVMARPWRTDDYEVFEGGTSQLSGPPQDPEAVDGDLVENVLTLVENVFPESDPTLAGYENEMLLLHVRDSGAADPIQFTEIAWTRFDGAAWTAPQPVAADTRGQFEPDVAVNDGGDGIAVWTQIKDASFTGTEIEEMAAEMEIMSATWDSELGEWGEAIRLTENAYLDHEPRLAGPMADGDIILTWRENEANLLGAGAVDSTRILSRRWDSATNLWGATQVLLDDFGGDLSRDFAGGGDKAVFLFARDLDGDLDTDTDTELFYRVWDEVSLMWQPEERLTDDMEYDRNAKVVVDSNGSVFCAWQRGNDLVVDRDFSGTPTTIRSDSESLGFSDFSMTVGPSGTVVILWQEMNEFGADAHYMVYDPVSDTWGLDTSISQDSYLERSFAPAWDEDGDMVVAYNKVQISKETKTVTLESGETVEIEGVPQPGQVDLIVEKRPMVRDLAVAEGSLEAEGATFLAGDTVNLRATVRNDGAWAEEDVQVTFYDGDPDFVGTPIETVTLPGWLKSSEEVEASIDWTIPLPLVARTVFVKVDPGEVISESDESNNSQSQDLNGVDLELSYLSGSVLSDGSVRVISRVANVGAPGSPPTTLALKDSDDSAVLAQVAIGSLAPGRYVEVPFELPPGSHPEGDLTYRLVVDEEEAIGDVDLENNASAFSLNLWIDHDFDDNDGDGIPVWWEEANGLSDDNPDDANENWDEDIFTNKQEYLSGTDPRDSTSYLSVGEVKTMRVLNEDKLQISFSWPSVDSALYTVERSVDLVHWVAIAEDVPATPPLTTFTDEVDASSPRTFYRVRLP